MKNKAALVNRILLLITVLWMCVIWSFSAKPADLSTEMSHETGAWVAGILHRDFRDWPGEMQSAYVESIDHAVRKTAHAAEYTLLGFLIASTVYRYGWAGRFRWFAAWAAGAGYAVSDEIHQYFVPGRSCQISDMLLDSCGVLLGVFIAAAIIHICRRIFCQ